MNIIKFAQESASGLKWSQTAKRDGITINNYLNKIKNSTDIKILSELARSMKSYKGFGGAQLTGFQRNIISAAAEQKLRSFGAVGISGVKKQSIT